MHTESPASKEVLEQIEKEPTWAEALNLKELFRVKGKKGLFFPVSHATRGGIVGFYEWLGKQSTSAHRTDVECIGSFEFHKEDGSKISMVEVLDNLHNAFGDNLEISATTTIMGIMVPGFDSEKFKIYHAKKVLEWYLEIKNKIKLNSEPAKE